MTGTTADQSRALAAGLALVLLIAGAVAGVAVDRMWLSAGSDPGQARWHDRSVADQLERFRDRFDLDDEQANRIESILHRVKAEIGDARASTRERARADIMAVLTVEQQARYRALLERIDARRR